MLGPVTRNTSRRDLHRIRTAPPQDLLAEAQNEYAGLICAHSLPPEAFSGVEPGGGVAEPAAEDAPAPTDGPGDVSGEASGLLPG